MVMDFELLLGGQVGHVKCEQVQNAIVIDQAEAPIDAGVN